MGTGIVWFESDYTTVEVDSLLWSAEGLTDDRQIEERRGELLVDPYRNAVIALCLGHIAVCLVDQANVVERELVVRVMRQHLAVQGGRSRKVTSLMRGQALLERPIGLFRV